MVSDGSAGSARALTWDPANRLAQATVGGVATSFVYGPDGARAKKAGASSTTLWPSADVEITTTGGVTTVTRYPHPDIITGTPGWAVLRRSCIATIWPRYGW